MGAKRVDVKKDVLAANDEVAAGIRHVLESRGIFSLNLISSPGSGKTLLLERTIEALKGRARLSVLAGDVQTRRDAERLERHEVPVRAIETRGGCHLSAHRVMGFARSAAGGDQSAVHRERGQSRLPVLIRPG